MSLFRSLIIIAVGLFVSNFIDNPKSPINNLPIVGDLFSKKIIENKCIIVIFAIALVNFIL